MATVLQNNPGQGGTPTVTAPRSRWAAFFELIGLLGPVLPPSDDPKRTARVIRLMLTMILLLLLAIATWVLVEGPTMITFVWGLVVAGCALLAGAALGVLFGLPSKRTVEVRMVNGAGAAPVDPKAGGQGGDANNGQDDGANQDTGYVESTNLERVADWLTTMIIGLTLTQYGVWEARYFDLSRSVTAAMEIKLDVCAPPLREIGTEASGRTSRDDVAAGGADDPPADARDCRNAQAIPGGMLMAIFAIIGFIISYLWMRRYFIFEMVTAREEERERYRRARELRKAAEQVAADAAKNKVAAEAEAEAAKTKIQTDAATQAAKIKAEADAQAAAEKARIEAEAVTQAAKVKAEADALAAAEKARIEAEAVTQAAKIGAEAAMEAAKVKAAVEADAARAFVELQAENSLVEKSPSRAPATSADLLAIVTRAIEVAPQIEPVKSRLDSLLAEIATKGVVYPNDPWSGLLLGGASQGGYDISAEVERNSRYSNMFNLRVIVKAVDGAGAVGKSAWFLIHPTFGAEPRAAAFDANGEAILSLVTYAAFTVGAILEDGTLLELNLASVDALPAFRQQ